MNTARESEAIGPLWTPKQINKKNASGYIYNRLALSIL